MALREIDHLLFGNLKRVKETAHYKSALAYYNGDKELKEYCDWQKERGKIVIIKKLKMLNLLDKIKEKGLKKPIKIDKNNVILDGHHRTAICAALGHKEIKCKVKY